jgi:hypothetical protein
VARDIYGRRRELLGGRDLHRHRRVPAADALIREAEALI